MSSKEKKRKVKYPNPVIEPNLEVENIDPPDDVDVSLLENIIREHDEVETEENIIQDYQEEAKKMQIDTKKKVKPRPPEPPKQVENVVRPTIPKIGTFREEIKQHDKTVNDGNVCKGCQFGITDTDMYIRFKCGHYMHDTCKERSLTLFSECCECSSPSAKQFKTESEKFTDSIFIPTSQNLPCNKIAGIQAIYAMTSGDVGNLVQSPYGKHIAESIVNSREPISPMDFGRSKPAATITGIMKSVVPQIYFETNPETAAVSQYSDDRLLDNRIRKFMARQTPKMTCQEMVLQGVTIMDIISDQIFIDEWQAAGYSPLALKAFTQEFRFLQHDLKFQMRHFNLLFDLECGIENRLTQFCDHFKTPRGTSLNGEYVYKEMLKNQWMGLSDNKVNGYVMSYFGFNIQWLIKNVPETCWHMFKYLSPNQFVVIGLDSDMFVSNAKVAKMIKVFNWDESVLATIFGVQVVDPKKSTPTNASKNNQITVQQCCVTYPPPTAKPVTREPDQVPSTAPPPVQKHHWGGYSPYMRGPQFGQKQQPDPVPVAITPPEIPKPQPTQYIPPVQQPKKMMYTANF